MIGWSALQLLGKAPAALQVQESARCRHVQYRRTHLRQRVHRASGSELVVYSVPDVRP